ncbi:MAG TPA: lipoyl synthase [Candidatus Thermoplasmatota archaeon]|nr:lipoyl synthase [Candidatus Thermoplasmatota archaeon]
MSDLVGQSHLAKPRWLVRPLPAGEKVAQIQGLLAEHGLHTVCEEARCPNRGECWSQGEATLMIMGDTCSRGCRFCDVKTGSKLEMAAKPLDVLEPAKVGNTVQKLALTYAVITSVDRDELPDQGADHWHRVIKAVKHLSPHTVIDVLVPDFRGEEKLIEHVAAAGPHVLAHNIETVRRLTPKVRDARCGYDQTLEVLRTFKRVAPGTPTKSGIMVGHGETREEVVETLRDLRDAGVDFVTIGQYLRPSSWHLDVQDYWHPNDFVSLEQAAWSLGFKHVVAGPFVRSSYRAWEVEKLVREAHGLAPAQRQHSNA